MAESYTTRAGQAVLEAARSEHDFGGWLAHVLAAAAAELGSTGALAAGRPGSWEAELVQRLVKGTVGWGDEYLGDYKQRPEHD
jgi:fructose-1-phosphate kinase PfkB-like protein